MHQLSMRHLLPQMSKLMMKFADCMAEFPMQVVSLSDLDPRALERATSPPHKLTRTQLGHPVSPGSPCSSQTSALPPSHHLSTPSMQSPFAAVSRAVSATAPGAFTRDSSSSLHEDRGGPGEMPESAGTHPLQAQLHRLQDNMGASSRPTSSTRSPWQHSKQQQHYPKGLHLKDETSDSPDSKVPSQQQQQQSSSEKAMLQRAPGGLPADGKHREEQQHQQSAFATVDTPFAPQPLEQSQPNLAASQAAATVHRDPQSQPQQDPAASPRADRGRLRGQQGLMEHEASGAHDPLRNPEGTDTRIEASVTKSQRTLSGIHEDVRSDSAEENDEARRSNGQTRQDVYASNIYQPARSSQEHVDIDQRAASLRPGPDVLAVEMLPAESALFETEGHDQGRRSSIGERPQPLSSVSVAGGGEGLQRTFSQVHTTLITPSEQVEELRGDISAAEAVDGYLGMSFLLLQLKGSVLYSMDRPSLPWSQTIVDLCKWENETDPHGKAMATSAYVSRQAGKLSRQRQP